ncbi:MAG: enoyl-CoA hydratase-related protein [Saprospiraceae bacterium]|nr:enoyl-CoA hydratase-related protein [Saprospiraceae bacterium]
MQYTHLLVESKDQILTVMINRPDSLNAINNAMMEDLHNLFKNLSGPSNIRGIILTGAGQKAFVAGADIKEFSLTAEDGQQKAGFGHQTFNLIESLSIPVVAAVNGFALGGGCELAMACHFRIASQNAKFGQPEVNLGLIPGYGGTQRLPRFIGRGKATEILLTGDLISAEEALRLGLVNDVVPIGTEVDAARTLLLKIRDKAPFAVAKILELVHLSSSDETAGFMLEPARFGECMATSDAAEGIQAFLQKRKPKFGNK